MSGICGIVNFDSVPVDPDVLKKMAEQVAYRGPDGIRYWVDGNVGFAHLALNATPESLRERQPLLSTNGLVCLTADARVDNRDELIRTLTAKGYLQQRDTTDAELILTAYQCWGESCPEHIIGDFAFAIWDGQKQRLFCARDAFGIKPLHYSRVGQTLCVASEAQQVLRHPAVGCHLNEVAMADYLLGYFDDERFTLFLDVQRLPPANRLMATREGSRIDRYWDVDPAARIVYRHDDDYAAHFLDLFRRAVSDRLRTQAGTVGITMSGGLDSCSVAAVAQQILAKNGGSPRLVVYSYAFDCLTECDERTYSRAMAAEVGIEIEYIQAEHFWFLGDPVAFEPSLETPFLGWESLERNMLGRLRDQGGSVLLTGQGGDSLLSGTARVYADRFLEGHIGVLWELARHARDWGVSYPRLLYTHLLVPLFPEGVHQAGRRLLNRRKLSSPVPSWITANFAQRTGLSDRLTNLRLTRRLHNSARQNIYESVTALGSIKNALYWYDRSAAPFGIETRHPFLDRRLAEFILAIPGTQLYRAGWRKWLLRQAMDGILPETIRRRKDKTNFLPFLALGLQEKEVAKITALLEAPLLGELRIVDPCGLMSAYHDYLAGPPEKINPALWYCITLELWLRHHRQTLFGDELAVTDENRTEVRCYTETTRAYDPIAHHHS